MTKSNKGRQAAILSISGITPVLALGAFLAIAPSEGKGGLAGAQGCWYAGTYSSPGACVQTACTVPNRNQLCVGGGWGACGGC
jgi:hypothetical protein